MINALKTLRISRKFEIVASMLLLAVIAVPALTFAHHQNVYVDKNASDEQDGSLKHPYKTIGKALKHANKGAEVHVASGTYKESIRIPEGIGVFGSSKGDVIIESDDDDDNVAVKMEDDSKINKITVRNGNVGVEIGTNDKASIIECVIEDNDEDGIYVKEGDISDDNKVTVSDSKIRDNGRAGIYSQKRRLVIINNEIKENDGDGLVIEGKSSMWMEGNEVKDNGKSGMRLTLDGSKIWTKNNTFRSNKREGIEVNAFGGSGRIDITKSKFIGNDRYGIARIIRGNANAGIFRDLTFGTQNDFWAGTNEIGTISPIIRVN